MAQQPTEKIIDDRSTKLNAEFKEYFEEVQGQLGPQDRDAVCCSWLLQKVAALQVTLEWDIERLQELGAITLADGGRKRR